MKKSEGIRREGWEPILYTPRAVKRPSGPGSWNTSRRQGDAKSVGVSRIKEGGREKMSVVGKRERAINQLLGLVARDCPDPTCPHSWERLTCDYYLLATRFAESLSQGLCDATLTRETRRLRVAICP